MIFRASSLSSNIDTSYVAPPGATRLDRGHFSGWMRYTPNHRSGWAQACGIDQRIFPAGCADEFRLVFKEMDITHRLFDYPQIACTFGATDPNAYQRPSPWVGKLHGNAIDVRF